ncbi:MAG: competence/damage-inducible protein A [Rhodoferax sp.]|jgi:molybdopterin-biosynthesis enzyme MoeA-like protein|nr:competence/damage-inducible protein A [Rhodoferax sp.]
MTPHFGIIIVGDEILSGKRADKHMPKAIELLAARGLQLSYADYVGDDPERITATLARAFAAARTRGDVVFSFGGIGATPDDHTRHCAARALGVALELHPQAKVLIRERMHDVAREQGLPFEPDREDNIHRLNMGTFPVGASIIPNPYNKIPGFFCAPSGGSEPHAVGERGGIYFVPGFPVMAWPMVEWVLDTHFSHLHRVQAYMEKSVIVMGSMEAMLTPLMLEIEARHPGVKVFSLPSMDHAEYGRHIELGVKGAPADVNAAFPGVLAGLHLFNLKLGPQLVR